MVPSIFFYDQRQPVSVINDSCHGRRANNSAATDGSLLFKRCQYEKRINLGSVCGLGVAGGELSLQKYIPICSTYLHRLGSWCVRCQINFGCSIFRTCHVIWWKSNSIFLLAVSCAVDTKIQNLRGIHIYFRFPHIFIMATSIKLRLGWFSICWRCCGK